jgi:hypothetical protein
MYDNYSLTYRTKLREFCRSKWAKVISTKPGLSAASAAEQKKGEHSQSTQLALYYSSQIHEIVADDAREPS